VQSQDVIAAVLYLMVVQHRRRGFGAIKGTQSTHQLQKQKTAMISCRLEVGIRSNPTLWNQEFGILTINSNASENMVYHFLIVNQRLGPK